MERSGCAASGSFWGSDTLGDLKPESEVINHDNQPALTHNNMALLFLSGGLTGPTFHMRQITHWVAGSSELFSSTCAALGIFSASTSFLEAAAVGFGTSVIRVSRICNHQPSTQPLCQPQQH